MNDYNPPGINDSRLYKLGKVVNLNQEGRLKNKSHKYLGYGWGTPEEWGVGLLLKMLL